MAVLFCVVAFIVRASLFQQRPSPVTKIKYGNSESVVLVVATCSKCNSICIIQHRLLLVWELPFTKQHLYILTSESHSGFLILEDNDFLLPWNSICKLEMVF